MNKSKTKKIALTALFTAIIAATAWISIPTPFGVNLAFTVFGVCLSGFVLGVKYGLASTIAYILLGVAGAPVFSQFTGGLGVALGLSGGFLWGFLIIAAMCGVCKNINKKFLKYIFMILSILLCHVIGVVQYSIVSGNDFVFSFLSASLPFLVKDIALVFLADFISKKVKGSV